jgi:hypothetical protein
MQEAKISITLKALVEAALPRGGVPPALDKLGNIGIYSTATSFKVAKLLKAIRVELVAFEAARDKFQEKYGVKNLTTNRWEMSPENTMLFQKAVDELGEQKVTLAVSSVQLPADATGLTGVDLMLLEGLVTV